MSTTILDSQCLSSLSLFPLSPPPQIYGRAAVLVGTGFAVLRLIFALFSFLIHSAASCFAVIFGDELLLYVRTSTDGADTSFGKRWLVGWLVGSSVYTVGPHSALNICVWFGIFFLIHHHGRKIRQRNGEGR